MDTIQNICIVKDKTKMSGLLREIIIIIALIISVQFDYCPQQLVSYIHYLIFFMLILIGIRIILVCCILGFLGLFTLLGKIIKDKTENRS